MKPRILITDDTIFTRAVLKNFLTSSGYHDILQAGKSREAVDLYRSQRPDLVLMEVTMPVKDGLMALKGMFANSTPMPKSSCARQWGSGI